MTREQLIGLAKKHGAASYTHRSDTKNPAYGFTEAQLAALAGELKTAALKQAAFECSFLAGVRRQSAKHSESIEVFDSHSAAQKGCEDCAEALTRLAKEPTE